MAGHAVAVGHDSCDDIVRCDRGECEEQHDQRVVAKFLEHSHFLFISVLSLPIGSKRFAASAFGLNKNLVK